MPHVSPEFCARAGNRCSIVQHVSTKLTRRRTRSALDILPSATSVKPAAETHPVHALSHAATASSRRTIVLLAAATAMGNLISPANAALAPANQEADPATSPYIQDLLKKTEAMRETRYIQRLRDYDRRNFRDYFAFEAGSLEAAKARGINEETYRAIQKWLKDNP